MASEKKCNPLVIKWNVSVLCLKLQGNYIDIQILSKVHWIKEVASEAFKGNR